MERPHLNQFVNTMGTNWTDWDGYAKALEAWGSELQTKLTEAHVGWAEQLSEAMTYKRRLEQTDCRNAGPFYEMSGIHCPFGQPCDRCLWERKEALLRSALEACLERLRLVGSDSESAGFIESCQPIIAQAEAALNHE